MIQKVVLKNFESHENSTIEFTDGLNLIIGPSNQGKSSIVRALALVTANRFSKESVRIGTDYCTVRVETDKGYVECERGEARNVWRVCKTGSDVIEYKSIGTGVPPEAPEILGMAERPRGEVKEIPNIMFQLEKHYMLSEIDGKRATSNLIARMLDEAIGLGGMEELIKDMGIDFIDKKKELSNASTQISELKGLIPEETTFEALRHNMNKVKELREQLESLETMLEQADGLEVKIKNTQYQLLKLQQRLHTSEGIDTLDNQAKTLIDKINTLEKANHIQKRINQLDKRLKSTEGIEALIEALEQGVKKYHMLTHALELQHTISLLDRKLAIYSTDELEQLLSTYSSKAQEIVEAESKLNQARDLYRRRRTAEKNAEQATTELTQAEANLEDLQKRLGKCPLCGGELNTVHSCL